MIYHYYNCTVNDEYDDEQLEKKRQRLQHQQQQQQQEEERDGNRPIYVAMRDTPWHCPLLTKHNSQCRHWGGEGAEFRKNIEQTRSEGGVVTRRQLKQWKNRGYTVSLPPRVTPTLVTPLHIVTYTITLSVRQPLPRSGYCFSLSVSVCRPCVVCVRVSVRAMWLDVNNLTS